MEAAPEFFPTGYYDSPEECLSDANNADQFAIDDLLDFPNDDDVDGGIEAALIGTSSDSSTVAAADTSCNSPFSGVVNTADVHLLYSDAGGPRGSAAGQFSGELSVPYDDLAELEWVSRFEYESFSTEDEQKLQLIQGIKARPETTPLKRPEPTVVPAKARNKRSRAPPGNWTSNLLAVSPTPSATDSAISSSPESAAKKAAPPVKRKETHDGGDGRKCLHCATDKTPQWRTGPMGPKTLCNACGVRYKSGRLVPEYRPASSPTFVHSKHSNSHRKVLELRRQKEMQKAPPQTQPAPPYLQFHRHQNVTFEASDGDDYLIHQHIGPDFRQMI